jgi:hypothetical protein
MKSLKDLVVGDIVRIAPMSGIGEAQDALVEMCVIITISILGQNSQ